MEFEWDEAKDAENRRKHGLSLADAARLDWAGAAYSNDERMTYGEVRTLAYGQLNGRLHTCVFTMRDDVRRIISLRKSNTREIRDYGIPREATPD